MERVYPAQMDRQAKDSPVMVEERQVPFATAAVVAAVFSLVPVFDLSSQVRTSGVVERADMVVVTGPPNSLLTVRISRPRPGGRPEDADVTQRPFKLHKDGDWLPEEWFQAGDYLVVERR